MLETVGSLFATRHQGSVNITRCLWFAQFDRSWPTREETEEVLGFACMSGKGFIADFS
jgi:hypothetical protein